MIIIQIYIYHTEVNIHEFCVYKHTVTRKGTHWISQTALSHSIDELDCSDSHAEISIEVSCVLVLVIFPVFLAGKLTGQRYICFTFTRLFTKKTSATKFIVFIINVLIYKVTSLCVKEMLFNLIEEIGLSVEISKI